MTETLLKGGPPGKKPQQRSASGPAAAGIWTTFERVQKMTGFVQHGSTYTVTLPVSTLTPQAAAKGYRGLFTYTVTVAHNYAVGITQAFSVTSPSGPLTGGHSYHLFAVNGTRVGHRDRRAGRRCRPATLHRRPLAWATPCRVTSERSRWMGRTWEASDLVDLDAYPLLDRRGDALAGVVAAARDQLARIGAAELPGFLSAVGLEAVLADGAGGGGPGPPECRPGHRLPRVPRPHAARGASPPLARLRRRRGRGLGPVRRRLPHPLALRVGHPDRVRRPGPRPGHRPPLRRPVGRAQPGLDPRRQPAPVALDPTDFVVSLAIRDAEVGGDFEVVPRIRRDDDECYDDVAAVLEGNERPGTSPSPWNRGPCWSSPGRHSLHRVGPIEGDTSRLVALSATTRPRAPCPPTCSR